MSAAGVVLLYFGLEDVSAGILVVVTAVVVCAGVLLPACGRPSGTAAEVNFFLESLNGDPSDWDEFEDDSVRERALVNMVKKNGLTFVLHCRGNVRDALGSDRVCATADPALVKELFLKKTHTSKRPKRYLLAQHLPGLDGVLFQDGEKWKEHTRALLPVFHASNFKHFVPFMHEAACVHMRGVGQKFVQDVRVDALRSVRRLATTIVLAAGYGVDPMSAEGTALRKAIDGYDEKARFRWAGKNPLKLGYALYWVWSDAQRIKAAVKVIVDNRIGSKQNTAVDERKPWTNPRSLNWIDRMIEAKFKLHDIFNEVNHLHAAHKAIAIIMTFALYELGRHPEWQDQLRTEFVSVLGANNAAFPTKELLEKDALPVTMSVWKETLRVHPISLGVLRETGSAITFRDSITDELRTVPKGTPVEILLQALHFHPTFWNAPEKFNPGRWDKNISQRSTVSDLLVKYAFVPFLDGQRQCQGRFLAELEFAIVIQAVVSKYSVSVPPEFKFTLIKDFYPELETPIPLILKPI